MYAIMPLWLLRHCESIHNAEGLSGPDCPLSAHGEMQAKGLTGCYDIAVVSPLKRARQTLSLSGIVVKADVIVCDLLREQRLVACDYLPGEDQSVLFAESQVFENFATA